MKRLSLLWSLTALILVSCKHVDRRNLDFDSKSKSDKVDDQVLISSNSDLSNGEENPPPVGEPVINPKPEVPPGKDIFDVMTSIPTGDFLLRSKALPLCINLSEKNMTALDCLAIPTQQLFLGNDTLGFRHIGLADNRACLDVDQFRTADGSPIYKNRCNHNKAQRFRVEMLPDSSVRFRSELNISKCMQLTQISIMASAALELATCSDESLQKFNFLHSRPKGDVAVGSNMLQVQHSGLCLEVDGEVPGNDIPVQQGSCRGSVAQIMRLVEVASKQVEIRTFTGGCLGSIGNTLDHDSDVTQVTCSGSPTQRWVANPVEDSSISFSSVSNASICLEIDQTMPTNRAMIRAATCTTGPNQRFKVLTKDSNFVAKTPLVPTVKEKCYQKIRFDLSAGDPADVKLISEGPGGASISLIRKLSETVCTQLYAQESDFNPSRYLTILADPGFGGAFVRRHPVRTGLVLGSKYLGDKLRQGGSVEQLFSGLLVHELIHVFQKFPSKSDGSDKGITEGIADAVRMRTRFPAPNWPKRDKVGPWDRGYERTGMFLLFIDQKVPGFINKINMARGGEWTKETIKSISGKSPEEWWTLYVADPTCSSSNYICGE